MTGQTTDACGRAMVARPGAGGGGCEDGGVPHRISPRHRSSRDADDGLDDRLERVVAAAAPGSYWLDRPDPVGVMPSLSGAQRADLAVVGAGYSGLWTALLAKQADPGLDVAVVEAETVAWAASGRNGGFCDASLTHGEANGAERFGAEMARLDALGRANLDAIGAFVAGHGVDCAWERTGSMTVAVAPWQLAALRPDVEGFLDATAVRAEIDSPTYLGGRWDRDGCALVDPVGLARGLRDACLAAGVRIFERTPAERLDRSGRSVVVRTAYGRLVADRVALGTNAFPSLLRRVRPYVIPVYDHVLVTEPLSATQLAGIGWSHRQGVADGGNLFHYYRRTADDRILWGGYDATYHYGRRIRPAYDQRPVTFTRLAAHFYETFPSLGDVGFTHRWGGAIDTCSRFCAFFGTAMGGRVAYAAGYTGLGVAATRFGAQVMLDLLGGVATERTELAMVRTRPVPFPPEPLGWAVIEATKRSIAAADRHDGRRNPWLRTLDRLGLGFDT
jgi:glycine/D-amino acid oxidase-like deaminating enzyme